MRICMIGKFPPIQGGVSMRTYWTAHGLAARGHDVHLVTNAKEVAPPFRMHMREADWRRCEAAYGAGSVTVHWTDPLDRSQHHIPLASPFVSKLAAIAARVHSERPFDIVLSHYMEPYGIAGHLAAQMASVPHVTRMAGSDAGRLWHHPQLEALYDHVLRSAEIVIAAGAVAERAAQRGVDPGRIAFGGGFVVPEALFTPAGPVLDLQGLRVEIASNPDLRGLLWGDFAGDRPYFGVCGKLGENKGSFALLAAMHRLKRAGLDVGLVALAQGVSSVQRDFRARARRLGLADRILQLPFLPHWRVPDFLRGCIAVCCLEQEFPIAFHTPIIPLEVLLCGTCLVGSTEVLRKLAGYGRLPNGYGCVAIEDVNDVETLSEKLAAIIKDPGPAAAVGARGSAFAREVQREVPFLQTLESILEAAIARRPVVPVRAEAVEAAADGPAEDTLELDRLIAAIERAGDADSGPLPLASPVPVGIDIVGAGGDQVADCDPLFRLRLRRWAMDDADLAALVPVRDPRLRIVEFTQDVSTLFAAQAEARIAALPSPHRSYLVAFGSVDGGRRDPLLVDAVTARILDLSDGTRTASEIVEELDPGAEREVTADNLKWIENLFLNGLLGLRDSHPDPA